MRHIRDGAIFVNDEGGGNEIVRRGEQECSLSLGCHRHGIDVDIPLIVPIAGGHDVVVAVLEVRNNAETFCYLPRHIHVEAYPSAVNFEIRLGRVVAVGRDAQTMPLLYGDEQVRRSNT